jgi:putative membrane protein
MLSRRATNASASDRPSVGPVLAPLLLVRTAIGAVLMGIANLIPGVSGGTMILAMGLYEEFIDSVADVTALRFSLRRIAFLAVLALFAGGAIVGLAGVILYLLFHFPVAMYSLFIGLTLGGAPLLVESLRAGSREQGAGNTQQGRAGESMRRWAPAMATAGGFALMIGVFLLKGGGGLPHNNLMDFVSGIVGATTMVLPGISGSYMLLVMDQYERVVGAVEQRDLRIIAIVGVGAILGIIGLSNALKYLLHHYHRATVGVLLGVLLGSVIGLWPFDRPIKREALEQRSLAELRALVAQRQIPVANGVSEPAALAEQILANWDRRGATDYTRAKIVRAIVLALLGFAATYGLSHLGEKTTLGSRRKGGRLDRG